MVRNFFILFIGFLSVFYSCNHERSNLNSIDIEQLLVNSLADSNDVFYVYSSCVFFAQMTSKECDSLEKINPADYEVYSEKYNDQAMWASELLKKKGIESFWSDKRYVCFCSEGEKYMVDTRKENIIAAYCPLYKPGSIPDVVEIEILEKELENYFNKKG